MPVSLSQWKVLLLPFTILYLYLVQRFRFHRSTSMPSQLGYTSRSSFRRMTLSDAWEIHNFLVETEFPTTFSAATMFALFKAYGIPSISSLLCATGQFSSRDSVDKRYVDTGCLLLEAVLNPPASVRAVEALARINFLHSSYRRSGKISDDDMLYTLSLFALEPARWVRKYEWRGLTDLERCAVGTLWKQLGEALGVNYDMLPGSRHGWKDGIQWLEELDVWSLCYQDAHMVAAESNKKVADATLFHILFKLPSILKPVGKNLVGTILEDKLREAMHIPKPPQSYYTFIHMIITTRNFILLHLTLPRLKPIKRLPKATSSGRMHPMKYTIHPWYMKPTLQNRYGLDAWRRWWKDGTLPGVQAEKYFPQGFVASELGPIGLRGSGEQEMEQDKRRLVTGRGLEMGSCPFLV